MGLTNRQKGIVHVYAAAAKLPDSDYRAILRAAAGVASAADQALTQADFEAIMVALETRLDWSVAQGLVALPQKFRNLQYWRKRQPPDRGRVTSRQLRFIGTLLEQLAPYWSALQDRTAYLSGILRHAIGRNVGVLDLTSAEASRLIDALKDRLAYHQRQPVPPA
jgi:hypothetical protein